MRTPDQPHDRRTASRPEPAPSGRSRGISRSAVLGLAALLAMAFPPRPTAAQEAPTLRGSVRFDRAAGRLAGDVCMVNSSPIEAFELNAVLHIRSVDGQSPQLRSEPAPGGNTVRYFLKDGPAERNAVCVDYSGEIPRFPDAGGAMREDDHASILAFDGTTLRARGPARWIPFPIDLRTDAPPEAVAFDLTLQCPGCRTRYVNGQRPKHRDPSTFRSAVPREPFLLLGSMPVRPAAGGWIVADDSLWAAADSILRTVRRIDRFYQRYLGLNEPQPRIDLVAFPEVRAARRGRAWAFFADPALGIETASIGTLHRGLEGEREQSLRNAFALLSHETAHRYFGWRLGTESPQRELFDEPFATVLELEAIRHFLGEDAWAARKEELERQAAAVTDPTPLRTAQREDFARDAYRYGWAPLQLVRLSEILGPAAFQSVLRDLLTLPAALRAGADFDTVRRLLPASAAPIDTLPGWQ